MTLANLIAVLTAFFKFPDAVTALVKLLSNTPEEKHNKLIEVVNSAFDEKANGGRPSEIKS